MNNKEEVQEVHVDVSGLVFSSVGHLRLCPWALRKSASSRPQTGGGARKGPESIMGRVMGPMAGMVRNLIPLRSFVGPPRAGASLERDVGSESRSLTAVAPA